MIVTGIDISRGFTFKAQFRAPDAPTIGTATTLSNTTANITFTAPAFVGDSNLIGYTAIAYPGGATGILNTSGSGTITVTGLTDNTNYTFSVTANNTDGPSTNSLSTNSILTNSFPTAPTISYVELTSFSTANIVYNAPSYNGNSTITGYTAVSNVGGITATVSTANSGNINVTGLISNTSYSFSVYAINQYGRGPSSNLSNGIFTVGIPGAPTLQYVRVLSGTTAEIVYTANNYIGNSNIVSYTATSNPGNISATVNTATSGNIIVGGLTIGTDYSFTVTATNLAGTSLSSNSSFTVTYLIDTYPPVEYLVVAGGGGGPAGVPGVGTLGGGGAGGFIGGNTLSTYQVVAAANTLLVLVGSGGAGLGIAPAPGNGFDSPAAFRIGNSGNKSVLGNTLSNVLVTATGGGGGGGGSDVGATPGGSGGGAYYDPGQNGIIGQGYPGAPGNYQGGGGGASQSGQGLYGGNGISSSITGTANYYAGGGAGGVYYAGGPAPATTYLGGLGGGGNSNVNVGLSGAINTGGGGAAGWGGGQYAAYTAGGAGGSGIVVVRYPTAYTAANTSNGSPNVNVTGGYRIYTYTSSGAISIPANIIYTNVLYTTVRTLTIPNAPTITNWAIGSTTATISYAAPSYNGNSNITSYTLVSVPENKTATVSTASSGSISLTGLTPNTTYVFFVYATNSVGSSVPSIPTPYLTTTTSDLYTTLLLSGNGINNATNNIFLDSSTNNYTITRNGNITQGLVSPYSNQVTSGSGYFNGTTDYFSTSSTTSLNFSGAFTVECWFRLTQNLTAQTQGGGNYLGRLISSKGTGSFEFYVSSASGATNVASAITVGTYGGSGGPSGSVSASGLTLSLNTWYHVVAVRNNSNVVSLFLNGSRIATATVSGTYASNPVFVGGDTTAGYLGYFPGFIGQTRAVNGTAVYDPTLTTLTVPTSPLTAITNTSLLLNFGNAGIYDSKQLNNFETFGSAKISTTQSKFDGSSIFFNGSTDYLVTRTAQSNFAFGTGDFTIECWIYPTAYASNNGPIWDTRPLGQSSTTGYQILALASNGAVSYGSGAVATSGGTVSLNTWSHVAVSRSGGNIRLFLNGTQVGSTVADSVNYGAVAGRPVIGSDANNPASAGYSFAGYIDDLRVRKGYAQYTANFTPPAASLEIQ